MHKTRRSPEFLGASSISCPRSRNFLRLFARRLVSPGFAVIPSERHSAGRTIAADYEGACPTAESPRFGPSIGIKMSGEITVENRQGTDRLAETGKRCVLTSRLHRSPRLRPGLRPKVVGARSATRAFVQALLRDTAESPPGACFAGSRRDWQLNAIDGFGQGCVGAHSAQIAQQPGLRADFIHDFFRRTYSPESSRSSSCRRLCRYSLIGTSEKLSWSRKTRSR